MGNENYLNEIARNLQDMEIIRSPEGGLKKISLIELRCKTNPEHTFEISIQQALKLKKCKICSGKHKFSEADQIKRLKSIAGMKFIKFDGEYKDSHTKCLMQCDIDGYSWLASINSLVNRGTGCPKCKGNAQYSYDEVVNKINSHPFFQFIDFTEGYNSLRSRVKVKCMKHNIVWTSSSATASAGMTGCKTCKYEKIRQKRRTPEETVINKINSLDGIVFIRFIGDYVNSYSKIAVKCNKHDLEWIASIDNLMNNRGCPKCGNVYKYSTAERLAQLDNIPDIEFLHLVEGKAHSKSKIKLKCKLDGFEWISTIEPILNGSGCPRCAHNSADLKDLLQHPELWHKKRYLYYIKFKDSIENFFWKIGLSSSSNLKRRYAVNALKKDGLVIIEQDVIELDNIDAVLTEYYIVRKFHNFSLDTTKTMVRSKGGTECFEVDILQGIHLHNIVTIAKSHQEELISTVKSTKFFKKEAARKRRKLEAN